MSSRIAPGSVAIVVLLLAIVAAGCAETVPPPSSATATSSPVGTASPAPVGTASPVAATESPVATPSPAATASPSPTLAPQDGDGARTYRSTAEITEAEFAKDGRIVLAERDWVTETARVVVLDGDGVVLPGWPWTAPAADATGEASVAEVALGPDASVYVAVRTAAHPEYTWELHRLDGSGQEMPGFPIAAFEGTFCDLATGDGVTALLTCEHEDDETGASIGAVLSVTPDGKIPAGWPVEFASYAELVGFRDDGAIVIRLGPRGNRPWRLTVLRADGTTARGWPRPIRDGAAVTLGPRGRMFVRATTYEEDQCGAPVRTAYRALRRDGTEVPGWRRSIAGWASDPLVSDDGSATILTEPDLALRLAADGTRVRGWPVRGVPVDVGCSEGNGPAAAGDGAVVSVTGRDATMIDADGRVRPGWPVRLPGFAATNCPSCVPGPSAALAPAVGGKGIWIASYRNDRPRVMGVDRQGRLPDAWQLAIGRRGDEIGWFRVAPNGRVWALLLRWNDADEAVRGLLVPVADDAPPPAG